jgi:uridine kinase
LTASTFVIAIAGPSGAGKSTLIKDLVGRLGHANALSLDSYRSSSVYPEAAKWIEDGADPNEFKLPRFDEDVRALKNRKQIIHPDSGIEIKPEPFLLLEEHFGRGRAALCDLIDVVIYLDTPLEVAYIRKLARKNDFLPWEDNPELFITNLRENMEWYQRVGRRFYLAVSEQVRRDCDLIVDGMLSTEQIVDEIMNIVEKRYDLLNRRSA